MVALALAAVIWGGMYVVSRVVLAVIPPLPLVVLRIAVALVVLVPLAVRGRVWRLTGRQFAWCALIGIVGYTGSLALQFIGTALTSASLGALITSASPACIVIFAAFGGERPRARNVVALALALLGVALVAGVDVPAGVALPGVLALLGAAVTWALYTVLGRRLAPTTPVLATLFWGLLAGGIALVPLAAPTWPGWGRWLTLGPGIWLGVAYLGAVAVALAFFLWNYGFAHLPSDAGAVFFLLQPVVGTALGVALLGERLSLPGLVGAAIILSGTLLAGTGGSARQEAARVEQLGVEQ